MIMITTLHCPLIPSSAQPAIVVLLELHKYCPEVFDQLEILVDGGFERGSDILKALALGASAVGLGRSFLYALTYGEEGVSHLIQSECCVHVATPVTNLIQSSKMSSRFL